MSLRSESLSTEIYIFHTHTKKMKKINNQNVQLHCLKRCNSAIGEKKTNGMWMKHLRYLKYRLGSKWNMSVLYTEGMEEPKDN